MHERLAVAINGARTNGGDSFLRHYVRTEFRTAADPRVLFRRPNGMRLAKARRRPLRAWLHAWWANGRPARTTQADE